MSKQFKVDSNCPESVPYYLPKQSTGYTDGSNPNPVTSDTYYQNLPEISRYYQANPLPQQLSMEPCVVCDRERKLMSSTRKICSDCYDYAMKFKNKGLSLRRLMAYFERWDKGEPLVYIGGSLRNTRIPEVAIELREAGFDVMDEWHTPGPEADDNWQAYEAHRERDYASALNGRGAQNTYLFDRAYMDIADAFIALYPFGRSASIELGYCVGRGKPTCLFLDGNEPDRYEVMPNFADYVCSDMDKLICWVREVTGRPGPYKPEFATGLALANVHDSVNAELPTTANTKNVELKTDTEKSNNET